MNIRARSKNGTANLRQVDPTTTLANFKQLLSKETGIPPHEIIIKKGFPPVEVNEDDSTPIQSLFANGDLLTVDQSSGNKQNSTNVVPTEHKNNPPPAVVKQEEPKANAPTQEPKKIEEQHKSNPPPTVKQQEPKVNASSTQPQTQSDLSFFSANDGAVIKRVIPDDNSCLFSAISYVLENKSSDKVPFLRSLVAKEIAFDPINYNEGILGKPVSEYQRWIQQKNSWGGAVEINIFSKHYQAEIMAYDVTRGKGHLFGEDSGFKQRVYLIYDGIHYDCLVWNLAPEGAHKDFDVTVFNSKDKTVEELCEKFVLKEKQSGRFVDEYNYILKCDQCGKKLKGNKEAVQHANTTGHSKFSQNQ